jgi:3-carboxy-cis,cis-muconate cycloisomerase
MVARTLGQQAAPSTFGRKAAGWLNAIDDAQARLTRVRDHRLAAQLGGPVGTLAAFGPEAPAVVAAFAARLGLAAPLVPWHTDRQRVLDLAAALGAVVATLGKIALDVELMTQDEVGEVSLAESGGSSSMPHKRNPTSAILITAGFHRTPGLIATLFAAAAPEHERASGGWHSEWQPWRELLSVAGGVAGHGAELLAQLRIDEARMRANLDATGGLLMADRVAAVLAPRVGRSTAHDIVARCVDIAITSGKRFADVVAQDADVTSAVDPAGLAEALDPSGSISSTLAMIDHALVVHRRRPRSEG